MVRYEERRSFMPNYSCSDLNEATQLSNKQKEYESAVTRSVAKLFLIIHAINVFLFEHEI